ncbi:enoyl-CoA delta isomerase 1, peroxisomal [Cajanus cajan]|uniref:Delta(3)-Delta(2)-enoyl-CoA isomerase n=1 Tax=Cajanus cajan TaxID=3821 RepID=A0A151S7G8_CAJCA|nr:enoyl-CoA delta isomerase 1, peroxisomal [Cajanus cajan]KYP50765.1 Carnitinyl-CoA dehydratase [Cajanus cajan]
MCTLEKRGSIFILTLSGDGEHRLNPNLLNSIQSSLRRVRHEATASSVLITTAQGKFFSNGYDLAWAQSSPLERMTHMDDLLRSVASDLLSLPMPTIAAVTGHASAAGYALALAHDYVLMRRDRGFLYMSELDIDRVIPAWFVALLAAKVGSPAARRRIVLNAAKLTAEEALRLGVVDSAYASAAETVEGAVDLAAELGKRKWEGHVYAQNRKRLLGGVIKAVEDTSERNAETSSRL